MRTHEDEQVKNLEEALRGLDYPAPRGKLVATALSNGASREVIARLLELPETADFIDEEALYRALGVRVAGTHPHGWE